VKIKELIEQLSKFDKEKEVIISLDRDYDGCNLGEIKNIIIYGY
jgi:5S rRNA maturation endonuclease (ribonuclease M5)